MDQALIAFRQDLLDSARYDLQCALLRLDRCQAPHDSDLYLDAQLDVRDAQKEVLRWEHFLAEAREGAI